jgi:hypothetical protein
VNLLIGLPTAGKPTEAIVPAFTGSVEVDGIGFGCVLLRTAALRALSPPYLRDVLLLNEVTDSSYATRLGLQGA